jgi:hypothetical protein
VLKFIEDIGVVLNTADAVTWGAANRIFSKKITDVRRRLRIRGRVALSARPTWPLQLEKGD